MHQHIKKTLRSIVYTSTIHLSSYASSSVNIPPKTAFFFMRLSISSAKRAIGSVYAWDAGLENTSRDVASHLRVSFSWPWTKSQQIPVIPQHDPESEHSGLLWALAHAFCWALKPCTHHPPPSASLRTPARPKRERTPRHGDGWNVFSISFTSQELLLCKMH